MPQQRLPSIASSASKSRVKPARANQRKRSQQQASSSSSSSSSRPPLGPCSVFSDSTMTPWGGLPLSESSFASIAPPPPPRARAPPPPPPPPAPQPTPATPRYGGPIEEEPSGSCLDSGVPSPPLTAFQDKAAGGGRQSRARRRLLSQRRGAPRPPRLPRLPPLRPVTNLSFSRSFTFSFFELPLHQSPCCHAERTRNLVLLLRQIHF